MTKKKKPQGGITANKDSLTDSTASAPNTPLTASPSTREKSTAKAKVSEPSTSALIICRNKYVTIVILSPCRRYSNIQSPYLIWCARILQTLALYLILPWPVATIAPRSLRISRLQQPCLTSSSSDWPCSLLRSRQGSSPCWRRHRSCSPGSQRNHVFLAQQLSECRQWHAWWWRCSCIGSWNRGSRWECKAKQGEKTQNAGACDAKAFTCLLSRRDRCKCGDNAVSIGPGGGRKASTTAERCRLRREICPFLPWEDPLANARAMHELDTIGWDNPSPAHRRSAPTY